MHGLNEKGPAGSSITQRSRRVLLLCIVGTVLVLLHHLNGCVSVSARTRMEKIPRKIWQSWKVDSLRFEDRDLARARTWTMKNPNYRYEVLTDDSATEYVEQHFGTSGLNRPDIVYTYQSLNAKIIKSDLLRYLVMYIEGGVYADIDVEAIRPVKSFIPKRFNERDVDMVIGDRG